VHREELATQNEELRRTNAALVTANERYAQLYDGAPMAFFTLDEAGLIVEANLAGANLLEVPRHFVFGRSFDEIVVPSSRESFRDYRRRLRQDARAVHETKLAIGARRVYVRIEAARLVSRSGGDSHLVLCVTDETQRRELDVNRRTLEQQALEARRIDGLGVLAGAIATDFEVLLTGVLSEVDTVAEDDACSVSSRAAAAKIRDALLRAKSLSKQLTYQRAPLESEPLDLSLLVRSMAERLELSIPEHISLELDLAAGLPSVAGERARLQQVIASIVENAVEAIGPARGTISIRTRVEVASEDGKARSALRAELVVLEVTDDGRGMSEEARHRAFEPLFSTKPAGRGLGLAIVHESVRAHGGAVAIAASALGGTTVRVFLPRTGPRVAPRAANDIAIDV
jgi:PAS domain S-box-containing protein